MNDSMTDLVRALQAGTINGRDKELPLKENLKIESLDISLLYTVYFPPSNNQRNTMRYLRFFKRYKYVIGGDRHIKYKGHRLRPADWRKDMKLWLSIPKIPVSDGKG